MPEFWLQISTFQKMLLRQ